MSTLDAIDQPLPKRCHVVVPGLPAGRNIAICIRGRAGVVLTALDLGVGHRARAAVRAINDANGISAVAEHAMLAGAMLGWACVMAEPLYWAEHDRRFRPPGGLAGSRVLH